MWILFAFFSSFFAGITSILSKMGISNVPSHLATAIRTTVVVIFSWILVFISKTYIPICEISHKTFYFLLLSGISTGISWILYFYSIQIGEVNKVAAVDKLSTILTILLSFLFLQETVTHKSFLAIPILLYGTWLMTGFSSLKDITNTSNYRWFFYSFASAFFASLTAIFGKIGVSDIPSQLGTSIRTIFVLLFAWGLALFTKQQKEITTISKKSWIFLILSGITTGLSWLCYYYSLQKGLASVVIPIDKLSIVVTVFFSHFILKETITRSTKIGLCFIIMGTLLLI